MTRAVPLALAVLAPLCVLAAGLGVLERVRTADDRTQEHNVGSVLNGRHVHEPLLDAIDAVLDRAEPQVVLLGNSIANTDFVAQVYARETGIPVGRIARLSVPNTMAAHWYAILENRVYARGHAPRQVLIVSDLQSLLATTPRSEASHVALTLQMGADEPVIEGKLGKNWWALERVRENRTVFRDRLMNGLRNRIVDLLVHHTLVPQEARPTEEALARVFSDERVDHRLHKRVLPVFNVTEPFAVTFEPDELSPVGEGFVPDLEALVGGHGGQLVFVRPPMSPRLPAGYGDVVPDDLAAAVPGAFAARGHVYLDLRAIPMQASHFQNLDHMNEEGARRFTWVLTDALREAGVGAPPDPGLDLLRSFSLRDGVLVPREVTATFATPPPNVPGGRQPFARGRNGTGWFAAGQFPGLADVATLPVSPHGARCSPLRVVESEATELGPANVLCEEVFRLGHGRTCHAADRVWFSASDATDPWDNGRGYTLVLDPERRCPESRWTYPREVALVHVPADEAEGVRVEALALRAADLGSTGRGAVPVLRVEILDGDRVVTAAGIHLRDLVQGTEIPFPPTPADHLRLRTTNQSDHFLLWQEQRLR